MSIRELAKTANVNGALISYYFSSKEGLYLAVLDEQLLPIFQLVKTMASSNHLSVMDRITFYIQNIKFIYRQNPYLAQLIDNELFNPTVCGGKVISHYFFSVFQLIRDILHDGIVQGEFKPDIRADYAALSLLGMVNFFYVVKPDIEELKAISKQSEQEYFDQAVNVFLYGIIRGGGNYKIESTG